MSVASKLLTVGWFLRRPAFWRHAASLARRRLSAGEDGPDERRVATAWAAARATDVPAALERLGLPPTVVPMPEREMEAARAAAASVPMTLGGPGDLTFLHSLVRATGARRVIETGVAYGWSTLAVLTAFEPDDDAARLVSVDMPYPRQGNETFVGAVVPPRLRGRWTLIRLPDRPGLRRAIARFGGAVDLAHYDSDKSHAGRSYAYPLLWEALAPGGVLVSDDIQDNMTFAAFAEATGAPLAVTRAHGKYAGALRKPGAGAAPTPGAVGARP